MKKLTLIYTLIIFVSSASAEQQPKQYLCITDISGGFVFSTDTNSWNTDRFKPGQKYLLKLKDKKFPTFNGTVTQFGQNHPGYFCEDTTVKTRQICDGPLGQFIFNDETLRFLSSYMDGYLDGPQDNKHTPFIDAGTCSPL